jgi:hypothetical protein
MDLRTLTAQPSSISAVEPGLFTAEASSLGILPGDPWPGAIEVARGERILTFVAVARRLGPEASSEVLGAHFDADGDLVCRDYWTASRSDALRVWND